MSLDTPVTVYLACIEPPLGRSGHYLGVAEDAEARWREHRAGTGSRLIRAALLAGRTVTFRVIGEGTYRTERDLKRSKTNLRRLCVKHGPLHAKRMAAQRRYIATRGGAK